MYLLKLAMRPWRVAPFSQLFSAIAVGFLLILVGFLFWIQQGLRPVVNRLQGEQVLTLYLKSSLDSKDENKVFEKVQQIVPQRGVDVKLIRAPQFIEKIKVKYPDLAKQLSDLGEESSQIIPRYISISGVLPENVTSQLREISAVESIETSKDRYKNVVGAFSALRWMARVLMLGVMLALFTGLIHLSRMNTYLHQETLKLLKLWGAGGKTLVAPGLLSGAMIGMTGGVMAWGGWMTLGIWLTHHFRGLTTLLHSLPRVHAGLAPLLFLTGAAVGILAGLLGGLSVTQMQQDGG